MKRRLLSTARLSFPLLAAFAGMLVSRPALAQQYWNTNGTLATLNTANWSALPAGPFTSAFSANGNIVFGANSAVTGATVDVGNITVGDGFTVTFTAGGTMGTGGNVRTLDVGPGATLNLAGQALSVAAGTGFIKNGEGILISSNANTYGGGFTLNAGTVAVGGVNAMGGAAGNTLTINGGTIRSNSTAARDLSGKFAGGITLGANFTLGDAVNTGALTFNNNMALGAATRTITANSTATLGGILSGDAAVGLTKEGTGALILSGANTFTGAVNVNGGTLTVAGAAYPALGGNVPGTNGPSSLTVASGATLSFQQVGTGATTANYFQPLTSNGGRVTTSGGATGNTLALNLNGAVVLGGNTSMVINGNSTVIIPGTTTVNLGSNALTIQTDGSLAGNTIGAPISGSGGSLIKTGGNALTLSGANTYSGATTVAGTLALDYGTQDNSKLSDTGVLTLGGNLSLAGATGSHAEVVASTTLVAGLGSSVTRSGTNTATVQLGTLTNSPGASINFGAAGLATTNNLNNSLGILGWWATITGEGWAVNSTNAANGPITGGTYTDVTRLDSGAKTITGGAVHTRIIEGTGLVGDITMAAAGTTAVNTLVNTAATAGTLDIGAGNTLITNAILQGAGAGTLTVGLSATPGTLTAPTAGGDLSLVSNAALTINSTISNNTSASTLTKYGTGTVTLSGSNDYTGATTVNAGTLSVTSNNALGTTAGATTINGGNGTNGVTLSLSGAATDLTIAENLNFFGNTAGRTSLLNSSAQNHTLTGAIDVSSDTNLAQFFSTGTGSITLSGDITGTMSNTAVFFVRGTSTSASNQVIGSVNLAGGNFAKTDAGTWLIGAPGKTYSWVNTQVAVGTLKLGLANVLPSTAELIMGNPTGATTPSLDLNGFNQTIAGITYNGGPASTGTRSITNLDAVNAAVLTLNPVTNYAPTGGSATNSVILAGNLSVVKEGAGTLTLSGVNTYTGATTVSQGILAVNGNATGNTAPITIGNGATLQSPAQFILGSGQAVTGTGATGFLTISPAGITSFQTTGNTTISTAGTLTISRLDVRGLGNVISSGAVLSGGAAAGQRGLLVGNTVASDLTINAGASLTTSGAGANAQDILGSGAAGNGTLIINGGSYTATAGLGTLVFGNGTTTLGSGTLTVNSGSATIGGMSFSLGAGQSGIVNLNGGTLTLGTIISTGTGTVREFNFDGGRFIASAGTTFPAAFTMNVKNGGVKLDTNGNPVLISSGLVRFAGTSTGGLTKSGAGTLTLDAVNTYSGNTTISGGILSLTKADSAADANTGNDLSTVSIAATGGATLDLAYVGTDEVDKLFIGGVQKAAGVWGAVGSGAANTDAAITGTGTLTVATGGPGGSTYATWIAGFFPGETNPLITGPAADPEKDGIPNAAEMVLGGNPATGMDTALLPTLELVTNPTGTGPIPPGDYLLLTYRRSAASELALVTAGGETDPDLIAPWSPAINGAAGVVVQEDLNFTFTPAAPADTDRVRVYVPRAGNPTLFGRLKVVVP